MADQLNSQQSATLLGVWNGGTAKQIAALRAEANALDQQLIDARYKASQIGDASQKARAEVIIAKLENNLRAMRQNINTATEGHNKIAGWIQTATLGAKKPGLAALPVIAWGAYEIAVAVASLAGGIVALSYLLDSISRMILAAQGKAMESKTLFGDLAGVLSGGASMVRTVAIIAGIGVAGFVVWKNWGSISGAFKSRSAASGGA